MRLVRSSRRLSQLLFLGITIGGLLYSTQVDSFVVPPQRAFARKYPHNDIVPTQTTATTTSCAPLGLFPSALLADGNLPADAFTDEVNILGDPTIQAIVGSFVVLMALLVLVKNVLGEMDSAIEKVLVDFETTLREKHAPRWTNIEKRLESCKTEDERAQKLFAIMEKLQAEEPEFMARLNAEMTGN
jgi:hypothetical protein